MLLTFRYFVIEFEIFLLYIYSPWMSQSSVMDIAHCFKESLAQGRFSWRQIECSTLVGNTCYWTYNTCSSSSENFQKLKSIKISLLDIYGFIINNRTLFSSCASITSAIVTVRSTTRNSFHSRANSSKLRRVTPGKINPSRGGVTSSRSMNFFIIIIYCFIL